MMDLKENEILGDDIGKHWYYRAKARALQAILQNTHYTNILDVGAGSAFFSRYLLNTISEGSSYCVDTGYEGEYDEDLDETHRLHFRRFVQVGSAILSF